MRTRLFITLICCGISWQLFSQDPQFSQFYAIPLYLNPAFTGNTLQGRIMGNYRHQWPSIPGAFVSYSASYDHNLDRINSGIGIQFMRDRAGSGGLSFSNISGLYAYQVRLSRKHIIKAGVQGSYNWRNIDFSKLTFGDQLSRGGGVATSETIATQNTRYVDFGSGILLYTEQYWVGVAAHHLNKPDQTLLPDGQSVLPIKYSAHTGVHIPIQKNVRKKAVSSVILAANYKGQEKFDQLDIGAYYNHNPLIFGVWYRGIPVLKAYQTGYANNDAAVLMVGYEINNFRVGYSYDITVSRLISNTAGSHEISLVYEYANPDKQRKRSRRSFLVPCAKF